MFCKRSRTRMSPERVFNRPQRRNRCGMNRIVYGSDGRASPRGDGALDAHPASPSCHERLKLPQDTPGLVLESDTASGRPLEIGNRSTAEATLQSRKACPAGGVAGWEGSGGLVWWPWQGCFGTSRFPGHFRLFLGWNQLWVASEMRFPSE